MLTRLFRLYARWRLGRLARRSPVADQRAVLARLIADASGTRFGADHGFAQIDGVEAFQARVPVRSYLDFWDHYWAADFPRLQDVSTPGLVRNFALTSGTTSGTTKYIPYTAPMSRAARDGMMDLLCHHVLARPDSQVFAGSAVMLSGKEDLEDLAPGIRAGAVSALAALDTPWLMRRRILPPPDLALTHDWEAKIARTAELSRARRISALGGSPNWILMFLDEVARQSPGTRLADWYPELDLIAHGGVSFAPYRDRFTQLLAGSRAETREVYSASEGFFAYADGADGQGMRLQTNAHIFYEFIPVDALDTDTPPRHWLGTIRTGVDYAVVLSSAAGLWAYLLGDTVRFVSTDPPRLVVTGRTSYMLSAFGEHLIEEELADAISHAAAGIGSHALDYVCTARVHRDGGTGGGHDFLVELGAPPDAADRARFAALLDARLAELNDDYRELRHADYNVQPPRVHFAPPGGFIDWMRAQDRLGGQNKVPRVLHDADAFDRILGFMEQQR